MADAGREGRW